MTYTEDMRVDGHSCLSESHSLHHIGCLASYARQTQETVEIFRHLSVIVCHYHLRQFDKVASLGIGITDALYVFVNLSLVSLSH